MYSMNFSKITVKEFEKWLLETDLLPGRRILLDDLAKLVASLPAKGINTLADLQKLLKKKKEYPHIAKEHGVSVEYLVILNREVNSYEAKPIRMEKLGVFTKDELNTLHALGLKTTKDFYEQCMTKGGRRDLIEKAGLEDRAVVKGLQLSDLLRINGVGPVFAQILIELGVRNAGEVERSDSEQLLENYTNLNANADLTKAKIGIKDIDYCKRFARQLDQEIEW